ncbi:MAG: DUF3307 domain-containing protein [Pseudomonadota bacterium]
MSAAGFETLIVLLLAHVLGDFVLQTDRIAAEKRALPAFAAHIAHVALLTALAVGFAGGGLVLAAVVASHAAMDFLKASVLDRASAGGDPDRRAGLLWTRPPPIGAFLIDQGVHIAVIAAVALSAPEAARAGGLGWIFGEPGAPALLLQSLVVVVALIALLPMGSIMIRVATGEFAAETKPEDGGMTGAGRAIGYVERIIVLALALGGEFGAVGFVIAAKSILRFGDLARGEDRKTSEYIIFGTLMSFAWALVVALLARTGLSVPG